MEPCSSICNRFSLPALNIKWMESVQFSALYQIGSLNPESIPDTASTKALEKRGLFSQLLGLLPSEIEFARRQSVHLQSTQMWCCYVQCLHTHCDAEANSKEYFQILPRKFQNGWLNFLRYYWVTSFQKLCSGSADIHNSYRVQYVSIKHIKQGTKICVHPSQKKKNRDMWWCYSVLIRIKLTITI